MKRNSLMAGLALVVVASSCGGSDSGSNATGDGTVRGIDIIRNGDGGATFVGKCQTMKISGKNFHVKSRYSFAKENSRTGGVPPFSEQIEIYSDKKCSDLVQTNLASGDYTFSPDGVRTQITFTNMLVIAQDEGFVNTLNQEAYCGISNWVVGEGRDVSREGSCWGSVSSASYLIKVEDAEKNKVQIFNCPNPNAAVPTSECVGLDMLKAD